jgi:acyl-CoA dehydrogenase
MRRGLHRKNKPEDKHGIRASNTAALFLEDVYVDADRLMGGVEGQGMAQAQAVFGYTRLMVAAFGLGAGWAALKTGDSSTARPASRAAHTLNEKQGYMDKLIVPNAVRLEAARAYIEWTAARIDSRRPQDQQTEGAVAKYLATEAGNKACRGFDPGISAATATPRSTWSRKFKRDVRITTIYEGTSEIMEWTISPRPLAASTSRAKAPITTTGRPNSRRFARTSQQQRRGHCGARPARRDRSSWSAARHRPPDPQPACPLPPGRADRLCRNRRHLCRACGIIAQPVGCHSLQTQRRSRAMSRIHARDAALKVAADGLRWAIGAGQTDAGPGQLAQPARHLRGAGRPARRYGFRSAKKLVDCVPGGVDEEEYWRAGDWRLEIH